MKVEALGRCLRSKILKPCTKLLFRLRIFKLRLKKPLFIKPLRFRPPRNYTKSSLTFKNSNISPPPKTSQLVFALPSVFCKRRRKTRKMDPVVEDLRSSTNISSDHQILFPSPITPAYVKATKSPGKKKWSSGNHDDEVEDACRSFENYLLEMIVEEGKLRDLMDVEELLFCWENLKCPIFIDLVSTFYGELCKDLFSNDC